MGNMFNCPCGWTLITQEGEEDLKMHIRMHLTDAHAETSMSDEEIGELRDELKAYKEQLDALREDLKIVIKYSGQLQDAIVQAASGPGSSHNRGQLQCSTY